jgi:hypothetical protein
VPAKDNLRGSFLLLGSDGFDLGLVEEAGRADRRLEGGEV